MLSHKQLDEALSETMARFGDDLRLILGHNLMSVILFGSAVLNDFTPGKGDLDFLVVTANAITPDDCERIFALHDQMRNTESQTLSKQLEGTYYPISIVTDPIRAKAPGCYVGTTRKGWKPVNDSRNSLIDYAIIKQHGRIYGCDTIPKIHRPSHKELVDEFSKNLNQFLQSTSEINDCHRQLSILHWASRGLCMTLTGKLFSKRHAAEWFATAFPNNKWVKVVSLARSYRYPLSEEERNIVSPIVAIDFAEFLQDIAQLAGITPDKKSSSGQR